MNGCKFYITFTKMKIKPLPDLNYLKECFEIDETLPCGLRWKSDRPISHFSTYSGYETWFKICAGKQCQGKSGKAKYYCVEIFKLRFFNHRIIYALHNNTTDLGNKIIDHIDGNKLNNKPSNLRLVTMLENALNTKIHKDNKTGYKNISFNKKNKKYVCSIQTSGKSSFIGAFDSLEEAVEKRNLKIKELNIEHHRIA